MCVCTKTLVQKIGAAPGLAFPLNTPRNVIWTPKGYLKGVYHPGVRSEGHRTAVLMQSGVISYQSTRGKKKHSWQISVK